ncbi:MAG: hypothetical protein LBS71_00405, partial [Puniceicoccales bacterium]|nr:hypothetical protein [Puniceicoccales bacterium]
MIKCNMKIVKNVIILSSLAGIYGSSVESMEAAAPYVAPYGPNQEATERLVSLVLNFSADTSLDSEDGLKLLKSVQRLINENADWNAVREICDRTLVDNITPRIRPAMARIPPQRPQFQRTFQMSY